MKYIKVRSRLPMDPNTDLQHLSSQKLKFTQEFEDKLYEREDYYRSKVMVELNTKIGLHNWAIIFEATPLSETVYPIIYCDEKEQFNLISSVLFEALTEEKISPEYGGSLSDYLKG